MWHRWWALVPTVRLHFKILTNPTSFNVNQMLANMQTVYNASGIAVQLVTTENLNLPLLNDLDVGPCTMGYDDGGAAAALRESEQRGGERRGVLLRPLHGARPQRLRGVPAGKAERCRSLDCEPVDSRPRGRARSRTGSRQQQRSSDDG